MAPATHLAVTTPPMANAGTAFKVLITALDSANHEVASYSGTVHFSSTDSRAVLPANSKLTNGTGSFSATLGTGGSQNVTATDIVTASITGTSSAIDVSDPATHLSVSAPGTARPGTSFSITVTAFDVANKIVADYSGTVHFSSSDHRAVLPYDSKLTNGTGSFHTTLRTSGTQTITATDTVSASIAGTSSSIAVTLYPNCLTAEMQCLSTFPTCCPGLLCRPATTRAYCEPASAAADSAVSKSAARLAALFPQTPPASPNTAAMHHHYRLIDLGTFGGPMSNATGEPYQNVINSSGTIVGGADTSLPTPEPGCYNPIGNPDCFIIHAFAWRAAHLKDLGTLRGGNYSVALEINERGQIVGASETDQIDPGTGEPEFHAVLWGNNRILDLGSLGGTASFAEVLNNHGQVVGNSLNGVPDPLSIMGLGGNLTLTQTHGFIWQDGKMRDLGTLGGPDSWASFVNERGEVAGASYTNDVVDPNTGTPQIDLFIWENGKMRDLGNLGGNSGSTVGAPGMVSGINDSGQVAGQMALAGEQVVDAFVWNGRELLDIGSLGGNGSVTSAISNAGDVVGYSWIAGDQFHHGFLWRDGKMIDLGTLGTDTCSAALALNSRGQLVGASQAAAGACGQFTTAFLWESGGPMVDLNALVPSDSDAHLVAGVAINEKGEIVAAGAPPGCPVLNSDPCHHAYALIPCDENHPDIEGCDYGLVDAPRSPQRVRKEPASRR